MSDLGDKPCEMGDTQAAVANSEFILRRKAEFRGSAHRPGIIHRTECPRVELARRAEAEGGAAGARDDPMSIDGASTECIGGGPNDSPGVLPQTGGYKCVISVADARDLQGLVIDRYMHQRMGAELRRHKATVDSTQKNEARPSALNPRVLCESYRLNFVVP